MSFKLLDGIRIIDLTMVFAGPVGTEILAEMGAEVIKIESAQRCDVYTRANIYPENKPDIEPWNMGCYFHTLNAGKYDISLNLGSDEGRKIFKRLIKISDVVIENFSPRVMENWGLSYEELKKIKQDIIMVSISGLGHYGPLRDFYMYVPGMEGMSGLMQHTGYPEEAPLLSGHAYGDWITGCNAAATLLTALYYRQRTGIGQYIDIAGREAVSCHIGEIITDCTLNNREQPRLGNRHLSMAPHGCYRSKGEDNWINIVVENNEQWHSFCQVIGNPAWTKENRFADAQNRLRNQDDLDRLVEEWTSQYDKYEAMEILQKAGIPSGIVCNMKDMNLNPHLIERGFFQMIDHGEGIGKRPIASQMPAKFSNSESFIPRRAPRFGQDNEYVFCNLLNMSAQELKKLEAENVIGGIPVFPQGRPIATNLIEEQRSGFFDLDYLSDLTKKYQQEIGK